MVVAFICVLRKDSRIEHFARPLSIYGGADGGTLPLSSQGGRPSWFGLADLAGVAPQSTLT